MLTEHHWQIIIQRINDQKCTPFLGAGICYGILPLGKEIAESWAKKYRYPLEDSSDLIRVAQFLALKYDAMTPKEELIKLLQQHALPDLSVPHQPHRILASLPLPIYITTNYDDSMVLALKNRYKDPKREICRWNKYIKDYPSIFTSQPDFQPTVANPLVFHFHGHTQEPESLVLTEDDYLDFIVNMSLDTNLLPRVIEKALVGTSMLFLGYRLADLNFRVLLRGLKRFMEGSLKRYNVAVMLPSTSPEPPSQKEQEDYLTKYFENFDIGVYWGTIQDFLKELQTRADGIFS